MKVWVINDYEHGDVSVVGFDTDILEIEPVKTELSYLVGGYEDERDEFIADVERMRKTGRGSAGIEERFSVELQEVR